MNWIAGCDSSLRDEEEAIEKDKNAGNRGGFPFGAAPAAPKAPAPAQTPSGVPSSSAAPTPAPAASASTQTQPQEVASQDIQERIIREYGPAKASAITEGHQRSGAIILTLNQLDDDNICDILERTPAYKRDRRIVESIRNSAYDTGAATSPYGSRNPVTPGSAPFTGDNSGRSFSF